MQPMQPMQQYMPPPPPSPSRGGGGVGLNKALSVVATVLAVVALAVSFVVPGPTGPQGTAGVDGATGPTGPTGPQGPSGPGTIMSISSTTATMTINASCTNYAQVTITIPSAGTVVVHAQAWVVIDHTFGQWDLANLRVSMNPGQCGLSSSTWPVDVPTDAPTGSSFHGALLQNTSVVAAGTYTFYLNGIMGVGQNAGDEFLYANMVAVFYPS